MRSSDLTVGRIRNLIDAQLQEGVFNPDTPFLQFLQDTYGLRLRPETEETPK